jgi:23S rRNA G2069 N7-methylase RlmK/C1962 C5-methylase RlmI
MNDKNNIDKTAHQEELLFNRLVKRYAHLRKWARRIGIDAYRLYDRDIPEIPLVLDLYGDMVSGAIYKRPYEKDAEEEAVWLEAMKDAVSKAIGIDRSKIFLKTRERQKGKNQYGPLGKGHVWKEIREGNLVFRVNLSDYLDTGLFLDNRKKRAMLMAEANGKKVLNLFCYTCSLSVAAAAGGAARTDSVDMSNTYLDWAETNFALNGIAVNRIAGREYSDFHNRKTETLRCSPLSAQSNGSQGRVGYHNPGPAQFFKFKKNGKGFGYST